MRAFFVAVFLMGGSPAFAASLQFDFVSVSNFCQCFFFDSENSQPVPLGPVVNGDGYDRFYELVGGDPYAVNVALNSDVGSLSFLGGSFVYDTTLGEYTNVSLQSEYKQSEFGDVATATYTSILSPPTGLGTSGFEAKAPSYDDPFIYTNLLTLVSAVPLDTIVAGDLVQVTISIEQECTNYGADNYQTFCDDTSGTATAYMLAASQVPVPAAVWLFSSALAGLGWMRRKQNA